LNLFVIALRPFDWSDLAIYAFKRQENRVFLAFFRVFLSNSFKFDQNRLKSILYYISSLFNQRRVLGGAYISVPEQIPSSPALLAPISTLKVTILHANEHEKRHNSLNFASIKTKFAQLIEQIHPVGMNLLGRQLSRKRERYGHISLLRSLFARNFTLFRLNRPPKEALESP
jgi:hypothetical protein